MIRKPIDLLRIHQKILTGNYDSLESMLLDVTMMFDNAMLFNEPDSVLYKVSTGHPVFHFTLQRLLIAICLLVNSVSNHWFLTNIIMVKQTPDIGCGSILRLFA